MRCKRMLQRKHKESATLTMIATIDGRDAIVEMADHQMHAHHVLAVIVYLVNSLAEKRPDIEGLAELKQHCNRLAGVAKDISPVPYGPN